MENKVIEFFTEEDILDFYKVRRMKYDLNNIDHQIIGDRIKKTIIEKSIYWSNEVIKKLPGFESEYNVRWLGIAAIIKAYTWIKIYKLGDKEKQIFFTASVDSDSKSLMIKLDYKYNKGSNLTLDQKRICKEIIESSPNNPVMILIKDLHNYNWDLLINKTISFIENNIDVYNDMIEEAWGKSDKRIVRLTFNENRWILPSGKEGKSNNKDTHENKYGFGHEEWLFDFNKQIDGYQYGFLEPIKKHQKLYENKKYNIWMYTIDSIAKNRYWIGEIKNLEVLNVNQAHDIYLIYKKNGWLNEMSKQLKWVDGDFNKFEEYKDLEVVNIRFKLTDILLNDPYILLPENHGIYNLSRYNFGHFKQEYEIDNKTIISFDFGPDQDDDTDPEKNPVKKTSYFRQQKQIEISHLHHEISTKLVNYLKNKFGKYNVKKEKNAGYGANKIDVVVRNGSSYIFYEIKTFPTLKNSIREAIGQLIEYSMWTNRNEAKELIVVTQPQHDYKEVKEYFQHLRTTLNLPIYYQSFDVETNTLSEKI